MRLFTQQRGSELQERGFLPGDLTTPPKTCSSQDMLRPSPQEPPFSNSDAPRVPAKAKGKGCVLCGPLRAQRARMRLLQEPSDSQCTGRACPQQVPSVHSLHLRVPHPTGS